MFADFEFNNNRSAIFILLILIILILAAYWSVQGYGFINYDDQGYVTLNYKIQTGITFKSITDTFTDVRTGHWHPLTMMSHMLDWQLFGENAGGHHWTSVIIHIINTLLLFLLFRNLTGAIWRSAFVAVLFAIHPINVESVAWIAERKNVLSTFFWISTMLFYVWYVKNPAWKRYLPVFVCFALGLMSKPILVTLPFVLLLLDYWPLNRTTINTQNEDRTETAVPNTGKRYKISSLLLEKVPLFVLTAISIGITFYAAQSAKAVANFDILPLTKRVSNAIISYGLYIKRLFWPIDLAVFYPLHSEIIIWQTFISALVLGGITVFVCRYFRKYPYLPVGWFWYLGTLVPVIGLVQVGGQAMADRYAYIPFIGIFLIMAWGVPNILKKRKSRKTIMISFGIIVIILLSITHFQVKYWENTFKLFEHAINVTKRNFVVHNRLGYELLEQNKIDEAIAHYSEVMRIDPESDEALVGLGRAFSKQGRKNEAIITLQQALRFNPKSAEAHHNLGFVFFQMGRVDEAIAEYQKAIALNNDNPVLHNNLGNALARRGKYIEAIMEYNETLRIQPKHAGAHNNLAMIFMRQGNLNDAISHFRKAIELQPEYANAHFYLSRILKEKGLPAEANYHFYEAIRINPGYKDKLKIRNNSDR